MDKIHRLETKEKVLFLTEEEAIEYGVQQIIKLANKDILFIKSPEHKEKIEKAVRGIMDAYADQKANNVDRFEVVDHRQCVWCRGRLQENRLQKNGDYKLVPCSKCDGSGIMGGRVYSVSSNPERSIIKVDLSYQDDGKTLKVFVSDR